MRQVPNCPVCQEHRAVIVARADDARRRRFIEYSDFKYGGLMTSWIEEIELIVLRCSACGHHWYRDQPDDEQLSAMYAAARSFFGWTSVDRRDLPNMRRDMRRLRRVVGTIASPTLLDFGSGYGRWARAARRAGFQVVAYEPSVVRGRDEEADFIVIHDLDALKGRLFDAINVEQVLEHVPDPVGVLRRLREFCKPATIVRITVPNIERAHEREALWPDWPFNGRTVHTMAPFEHLHGFTVASLERLVHRAGFRPVHWTRLAAWYPQVGVRRLGARVWSRLSQTFMLVELGEAASGADG